VRIRVVIVDDTDSLRELMRAHVEAEPGMEVVGEAVDGLHAVAVVRQAQPDAVILDVEMPVMDGLQALPGLLDAAPGAKIVVFSSRLEPNAEESARRRGAAGFFLKGQVKTGEVVSYVRDLFAPGPGDGPRHDA
jgi:DNA-binding NarL/FixJ family response regulator